MKQICMLLAVSMLVVAAGCGSEVGSGASSGKAEAQSLAQSSAQSPAQAQLPASPPPAPLDSLEQLLAPVALYPDALLAQVLTAATSPQQVTEVNTWLQQNNQLQGTALQDAANQKGFDASFVALVLFPDVLDMLASNIDWTTELGTAFLSDS